MTDIPRTYPVRPVRGEVRVIRGERMRFIEADDRGDVWELLAPSPAVATGGAETPFYTDKEARRQIANLGAAGMDWMNRALTAESDLARAREALGPMAEVADNLPQFLGEDGMIALYVPHSGQDVFFKIPATCFQIARKALTAIGGGS